MPSQAASTFQVALDRGGVLRSLATDARLEPNTSTNSQACLHAALAAYVAAWQGYCEAIVHEYFDVVSDPTRPDFRGLHSIARGLAERSSDRFNTPTFEKARDLLFSTTGFDPYSTWSWPARRRSVLWIMGRLNDVLRIRHSFAHGFPLPANAWTTGPSGRLRLTAAGVDEIEAMFRNLVRRTDAGLAAYVLATYGKTLAW